MELGEGRSWHPRQGQLETAFLLIDFSVFSDRGSSLGTGQRPSHKWQRSTTTAGTGEEQALGQKIGVKPLEAGGGNRDILSLCVESLVRAPKCLVVSVA